MNKPQDLIGKYGLKDIKTPFTLDEFWTFTGLSYQVARALLHNLHQRGYLRKFQETYRWTASGRSQHTRILYSGRQ